MRLSRETSEFLVDVEIAIAVVVTLATVWVLLGSPGVPTFFGGPMFDPRPFHPADVSAVVATLLTGVGWIWIYRIARPRA